MNISQRMIHEIEHVGLRNPTPEIEHIELMYQSIFEKLQETPGIQKFPLYKINEALQGANLEKVNPEEFLRAIQPKKNHFRFKLTDNHKRLLIIDNILFYDNQ